MTQQHQTRAEKLAGDWADRRQGYVQITMSERDRLVYWLKEMTLAAFEQITELAARPGYTTPVDIVACVRLAAKNYQDAYLHIVPGELAMNNFDRYLLRCSIMSFILNYASRYASPQHLPVIAWSCSEFALQYNFTKAAVTDCRTNFN